MNFYQLLGFRETGLNLDLTLKSEFDRVPDQVDYYLFQTLSIANKLRLFTQATSLGGVESLVEHRKSVEGAESQTPENLLRLSLGIEHIEDLIDDWKQALI